MYPQGQWGRPQGQGYGQQPQPHQQMMPQQTGYPGMSQMQRPMATGFAGGAPQGMGMGMGGFQQPQQTSFMQAQPTGMGVGMGGMGGSGSMLGPGGSGMLNPQQQRFLTPSPGLGGRPGGGGLMPQQTGFPQQQQQQGLMPQQTGYPGGGGLMPQQTGYPGGGMGMGGGLGPQQTGLIPQATGYPGFRDPRLQLMSSQFMPAAQPFAGAHVASNMQFSQASLQPSNFQGQIQTLSQQQQGTKEPKIPWALSKEERKSYDSIFRAWDQTSTGFISGDVAREVFGQSGLDRDRLMQIWHLADTENRGKLNLAEFHVAMGLIYRALNGNDIPEQLPPELVPPSARDLNDSVDFLKDLLKRDTNVRNTTGLNLPEAGSNSGASYSKARSFHENPVAPAGPKKDATAYRHQDKDIGGYKSNSRHLDRRAVRFEGQSAADDLSEMKRQLANTQKMLDKQDEKDEDDRELERELDDLRFRIRRVQDDIEYVNRRGGRDSGDERRKLERELLHLMHERLPQLERRMEEKERRQRDRQYDQSRERDRRNESSGKYSERDRRAYSSFDRERDSDRYDSPRDSPRLGDGEYLRGTFERERERDGSRDRYGDRDGRSPPRSRDLDNGRGAAPPPPPPPAEAPKAPAPPPPAPPAAVAPAPAASPAPSSGAPKNMTPEERQAWIRSEAQRRIQERMRALGAAAPASASAVDTSVEERLKADQAEAQARSAKADEEAAERERTRRARLEEQKIKTDKAALSTVKAEMAQAEKGPESERPPAPVIQAAKEEINDEEEMIRRREAVLAKEKAERLARLKRLEEEEEEARRQEAAFKERQSMFSSKAKAPAPAPPPSRKGKGGPPPPPPSRKREDAAPAPPAPPAETPSAPAPPAPAPPAPAPPSAVDAPAPPPPPAPPAVSPSGGSSTNPFHRMQQGSGSASTPAASTPALTPGGTNPFFRMQQEGASEGAPAGSAPQAQRAAAPIAPQPTGRGSTPLPQHGKDEDWEDSDKEEDDDDDGPGSSTRATRANLAQQLFSGLIPGGRATPPATPPSASSPAPPPPPPAPGAPFPPSAPAAPATLAFVPPSAPADRGALLSQISGGLRLKKTQTVDKSKPLVTGAVIGDAAPPVQTYVPPPSPPSAPPAAPPAPEPEPEMPDGFGAPPSAHEEMDAAAASANPNRQSVDWAASLAADQMNGRQEQASRAPEEPSLAEEDEEDSGDDGPEDPDAPVLGKQNGAMSFASADTSADPLNDVDTSVTTRMRSLYAYSGQREEDLSFDENVVVLAHPAKDPANDWWYGVLVKGGAKGWFPKAYVQSMEQATTARALYDYAGTSPEEASLTADEEVLVVDREDANWWRIDRGDSVLIAPATYLEVLGASIRSDISVPAPTEPLVKRQPEVESASALTECGATQADPIPVIVQPPLVPAQSQELPGHDEEDEHHGVDEEEEQLKRAIRESEITAREEQAAANAQAREDEELQKVLELSRQAAVQQPLATEPTENAGSESSYESSSESTTGWTSSDDDDDDEEDAVADTEEARAARAAERFRVLQAAGLIVTDEKPSRRAAPRRPPPDLLVRRKSSRQAKPERPDRRPPRPKRSKEKLKTKPERPLPPVPASARPAEAQMEDAYDRFLKLSKEVSLQRLPELPNEYGSPRPASVAGSIASTTRRPFSPPTTQPDSPALSHTSETATESRTSGFLNSIKHMSRAKMNASPMERRPTPTISGPISAPSPQLHQRSESSQGTSASPMGTTSWSSIVGPSALEMIPDKERKRQEAIFELIATESAHVRDLQIIVEVFFNSMQQTQLLSEKASTVIFANVEDVLLAAVSLLSDLEERQRDNRLYIDHIGDILAKHMPGMQVYMPYCVNQASAAEILQAERQRDPAIASHLQNLRNNHPAARNLDLSSFLLIPMQRLARYPLLISQIEKYTNEDHPDHLLLHRSSRTAESILNATNESIRERETKERLTAISETLYVGSEARLDLTKPTRLMGERKILKEELLSKQKSGRKLTAILFNDLFLLLHDGQLYRMPMPLELLTVQDVPPGLTGRDDLAFQIVHNGQDKVNLRASSPRACHAWMRAIESARQECVAAVLRSRRDSRRDSKASRRSSIGVGY